MKSGKSKVRDSIANLGNLKDQLNCVIKEIHMFSAKIEDIKAHGKEEDLGYKRFADIDTRLSTLNNKYKGGRESSKATMFLIKTILEALCEGPLCEKDIKTVVLDRCKELSIKSTNRGTIAGLNMDVGVACNILSHLGALELHTQGTSTPAEQKAAGLEMLGVLNQRWDAHLTKYFAECKKEALAAAEAAATAAAAAAAASAAAANATGGVAGTPSSGAMPAGETLEQRMLSPLLPSPEQFPLTGDLLAPSSDLADLSFGLESPLPHTSSGNANQTHGSGHSHPSAPNSLAGSNASAGNHTLSSAERMAKLFEPADGFDDPVSGQMDELMNLDQSAFNDSELIDSLMERIASSPLNEDCTDFEEVNPEDFGAMDVVHDEAGSVAPSTNSKSNSHPSTSAQGGKTSKPAVGSRRTTASQRLWRIVSGQTAAALDCLLRPEDSLRQWSSAVFRESLSMEIEEHLLRRIAGQCDLHIKPTPFRQGTRYLDPNNVSFEDVVDPLAPNACASPSAQGESRVGQLSQHSSASHSSAQLNTLSNVPALYDDHVSITGSYLLDKIKRSKRQRGSCLYSSGSSVPQFNISFVHSLSSICSSTTSHYWNNSLKFSASNAMSSSASTNSLSSFMTGSGKKAGSVSGGGGGGGGKASASDGSGHAMYPKHYSQPTLMAQDWLPMPVDRRPPAGSSAKIPLYSTAVHMPDLSTYTTEEPWSTVSREFVVLSGEDAGAVFFEAANIHGKAAVPAAAAAENPTKKQKLAKSESNSNLNKNSSSSSSANKKSLLPVYDVAAPQFREVVPPPHKMSLAAKGALVGVGGGVFYTSPNKVSDMNSDRNSVRSHSADEEDPEEDLSDEAILARHDAVLRGMREKWALLQQLKNENRRGGAPCADYAKKFEGGAVGEVGAVGGAAPFVGSGAHMKYRKYANGEGGAAAAKKKGVYPLPAANGVNGVVSMKRRGRPPKFVKNNAISQRGNNQYTAIRAGASPASSLPAHTSVPSELGEGGDMQVVQSTMSTDGITESEYDGGEDAAGNDQTDYYHQDV